MKIRARIEGLDKAFVPGKLSEDAQFDLRVISDDQSPAAGMAHEAAAVLSGVRHLLNIWIRAGKAAGRSSDLTEVGVQPACLRINELDHVLAVTRQRFLHGAVLEQLRHDWILRRQRLQLPIAR